MIPDVSNIEQCEKDLELRRQTRLKYPGACSLMYQNVISVFIDCLLKWNPEEQKGNGPGILGNVVAFAPAHEEQARYTLHSHWQVWVEELSNNKRLGLWDSDPETREKNREEFYEYVDSIMKSSYTTPLSFKHDCNGEINNDKKDIFQRDMQTFRDARHETLCFMENGGKMLQCRKCDKKFGPTDIVENTFIERLASYGITQQPDASPDKNQKLSMFTDAQLDVAAYSHVYDFYNETEEEPVHIANTHWGDEDIRSLMLQHRFEYHCESHRHSCFKKGCECRFLFPFISCDSTLIDQDESKENANSTPWNRLSDPHVQWISPWMLVTQRNNKSEYVNTFNCAMSEVFNCNTNIQIGDVWQVYYSTLYGSKSTQKEDSDRVQRILQTVVRRLSMVEEDILMGKRSNTFEPEDSFTKALCVLLSGLRAATSRHVVSSTMAHLLMSFDGHRFQFSHKFGHLLISQLEATLEGNPIDCRLRSLKFNGRTHFYGDSTSADYIHRPICLEDKCACYISMWYTKSKKTKKEIRDYIANNDVDMEDDDDNTTTTESSSESHENGVYEQNVSIRETAPSEEIDQDMSDDTENIDSTKSTKSNNADESEFTKGHEARMYTKMIKRTQWVVPMMFYDGDSLCNMEHLQLGHSEANPIAQELREEYAKVALMMFYPFRNKNDLLLNDNHWDLFEQELNRHNNGEKTLFWSKGFEILQNIENRRNLQHNIERREDTVTRNTRNRLPTTKTRPFESTKDGPDIGGVIP